MKRRTNNILRSIAPDNLRESLRDAQREIDGQLKSIVAQLSQQADSTFGDSAPWGRVGRAGFGDKLIEHGKCLIELG